MQNSSLRGFIVLAAWLMAVNGCAHKNDSACDPMGQLPSYITHFMLREKSEMMRRLSEEQKRQFSMLSQENKQKLQILHEALRENHRQIYGLIASGAYTEEKAARLAEQQGDITAEVAKLNAAEMAGFYAMLTTGQQKEFFEVMRLY